MQHQRKLDVGRPVLLSANRADLVAGCTLPEAFKSFVLDDPGLGSGLIDHSQKMTTAAMHMADMNV
jgi:hypothetical protein